MGRNKRNKNSLDYFRESANLNNATFAYYINRLCELSISMFEWQNLPESVNERYLETVLFYNGIAVYFKDDVMGDLCLDCLYNGNFDVYGNPVKRRAYSKYNHYQKMLDENDSVVIWNNYLHTNTYPAMQMFAYRLYDIDRTADINIRAQKTPVLVQCSQQQRMSMLNVYKEWDGNAPVIFGDKNLDVQGIKTISTEAPFVAESLYTIKARIWSEALSYLGIENSGAQKRERLLSQEAASLQGDTIASRYSRLESRRFAVDKINKMFGTNIKVNFREDFLDTNMMNELGKDTFEKGYYSPAEDMYGGKEDE